MGDTSLTVLKKDGTVEVFDMGKISRVAQAAGLEPEQADHLAKEVAEWAYTLKKNPVPSLEMRIHILTLMQKVKPYSAGLYEWYEKTKDGTA